MLLLLLLLLGQRVGTGAVDTGTINYFLYFLSISSPRGTGEERKRKETCPEREREREGIDTQTESSVSEGERGTERESCLTGNKKEAGWGIYPKTPTGRRGSGVTRRLAQQGRGGRAARQVFGPGSQVVESCTGRLSWEKEP